MLLHQPVNLRGRLREAALNWPVQLPGRAQIDRRLPIELRQLRKLAHDMRAMARDVPVMVSRLAPRRVPAPPIKRVPAKVFPEETFRLDAGCQQRGAAQ